MEWIECVWYGYRLFNLLANNEEDGHDSRGRGYFFNVFVKLSNQYVHAVNVIIKYDHLLILTRNEANVVVGSLF